MQHPQDVSRMKRCANALTGPAVRVRREDQAARIAPLATGLQPFLQLTLPMLPELFEADRWQHQRASAFLGTSRRRSRRSFRGCA
jgi:hypothetical protein